MRSDITQCCYIYKCIRIINLSLYIESYANCQFLCIGTLKVLILGNLLKVSAEAAVILQLFTYCIHRGSYMSAHVLLNLLNELGKKR